MYNRGIDELLQQLPRIGDLDAAAIKRMLTQSWITAEDFEQFDTNISPTRDRRDDIRRLANALEVYAILPTTLDPSVQRACAFVAAEALEISSRPQSEEFSASTEFKRWTFGSPTTFEHIEAGLLYLIAGYDANAAVAARSLDSNELQDRISNSAEFWLLKNLQNFLNLRVADLGVPPPNIPDENADISTVARHAVISGIGDAIQNHLLWLTFSPGGDQQALEAINFIIYSLEHDASDRPVQARYADLHHLALLIAAAIQETTGRALRSVSPPSDDGGRFATYQRNKAASRPLLWPAAAEYAEKALPGPSAHAVVSVPTGAGKSSVAELAVCQALKSGWVLYLTPTNALSGQVRRHLAETVGRLEGVKVRDFLGGLEYTELAGETLGQVTGGTQVLVMTPEKCSLALRQNPEEFGNLSLCVFDEAHLIGDGGTRAVLSELVVSEIIYRAPDVRFLMLSALLANPEDLASWIGTVSEKTSIVIDNPWRPTRTLRAMAGFFANDHRTVATEAREALQNKPARRKNHPTSIPISLLASLQGAWKGSDLEDYALTRTNVTIDLNFHRDDGLNTEGYYGRAASAFAQNLGTEGHRVLVFLPRSKHDSFKYALEAEGFEDLAATDLPDGVSGLIRLANEELGATSLLGEAILKGVAVHTSAMLREEQRASEIAFDSGRARIFFATGALAQGLNLPATAVIIGGTSIGYDPNQDFAEAERRARSQLLNAIGRAGRATVAARSMAIVIPNKALYFQSKFKLQPALKRAEFLQHEDASSEVASQLDGLIQRARDGSLNIQSMSRFEEVAFSFLSFSADGSEAEGVIRNTWAVHRANAANDVDQVTHAIGSLGARFLLEKSAPNWISLASHKAGLPLPQTAEVELFLRWYLLTGGAPESLADWTDLLVNVLESLSLEDLSGILSKNPFGATKLLNVWSEDEAERTVAWDDFRDGLHAWMAGEAMTQLAVRLLANPPAKPEGRGQSDSIPKVLRVVENGFSFQLSVVAGALGAVVAAGRENDSDGPWEGISDTSLRQLNLLPLAVRLGTNSPEVTAWVRAGARPRRVGHLLAEILPPPPSSDDEEMRRYCSRQLNRHPEFVLGSARTPNEHDLLRALVQTRLL
ncbi:DEAD/DEAH box helicase [Streptomyces sp. NPDC002793]|uniref:DEAD/DEAH box helicase n=1 Tax=Streptomyces sp. NPDC002793 TaxID=3154432 RepID=UPI0033303873